LNEKDFEQLTTAVHSHGVESDRRYTYWLSVTAGPDRGVRIELSDASPQRVLIGKSPSCELRLTDNEVSRRHAALERTGDSLRITDLNSTNGTFVDRVRVFDAELAGGEIIRIGASTLSVEVEESKDRQPDATDDRFGTLLGASRALKRLYPLCRRLAMLDVAVLIEGETGTGKEMLAESLHREGSRKDGPFVVFDCTALHASLMESELFGHEKGAFTGAVSRRLGVFEQAHGGTLLIDEIGDLDILLQAKLLRAVERGEIRRLGGDRAIQVDVRILSATRRSLDREVELGRFRDDLYHRLAVARIELPPLRSRRDDIDPLVNHFWRVLGGDARGPSATLLDRWRDDDWPGNVRELRNAVLRQIALGTASEWDEDEANPSPAETRGDSLRIGSLLTLPFPAARDRVLELFERLYVARVLELHGGDVNRAATASGIGLRYFQKLRARTGQEPR
jgi:DNA-binding NtrC family response regulator